MVRSWFKVVHLAALAIWTGSAFFFTFIAAASVFGYFAKAAGDPPPGLTGLTRDLGRRMAGGVVGEMLPKYFALQVVCGLLAVAAATVSPAFGPRPERVRRALLIAALLLVVANWQVVLPQTVRLGDEHWQAKQSGLAEKAADLDAQFGAWHGVSMLVNLLTFAVGLAVLCWTAVKLDTGKANTSIGPPP